jgi:glutamine amidotransferase
LISCENSLIEQSEEHSDGWGLAYFTQGVPHLVKNANTAIEDQLFQKVSGIVSSETVLAHLRRATVGELSMVNSHPFQYGHWVFAHNGEIPDFDDYRDEFLDRVKPHLRRFILGTTDSEVIFYHLLSRMEEHLDLESRRVPLEDVIPAVEQTLREIHQIRGQSFFERPEDDEFDPVNLSFILTNGQILIGHQGGKPLYFSTHKDRCPERDTCSSYSKICEQFSESGPVSHLLVSSEPLTGANVWREMGTGEIVGVNSNMSFRTFKSPLKSESPAAQ